MDAPRNARDPRVLLSPLPFGGVARDRSKGREANSSRSVEQCPPSGRRLSNATCRRRCHARAMADRAPGRAPHLEGQVAQMRVALLHLCDRIDLRDRRRAMSFKSLVSRVVRTSFFARVAPNRDEPRRPTRCRARAPFARLITIETHKCTRAVTLWSTPPQNG